MESTSLLSLFESNKEELISKLSVLTFPKDSDEIQKTVGSFLDKLLDKNGDFRMSLTQSEDYVLNSSLSLLSAQQSLYDAFISPVEATIENSMKEPKDNVIHEAAVENNNKFSSSIDDQTGDSPRQSLEDAHKENRAKIDPTTAILGSGGGAFIGQALFKSFGAVIGAVAGTAAVLYSSMKNNNQASASAKEEQPISTLEKVIVKNVPVDVDKIILKLRDICGSVDNIIATYRAQIRRVVNKYESQERPTLEKEYKPVLESIQTLIGYERERSDEEKYVKKMQTRVEDLVEVLDTYNLSVVDYSGENSQFFTKVNSPNTSVLKKVYPAIIKDNTAVLMGKVFVPVENNE